MVQGFGSHGIFHWNSRNNKDSRGGFRVSSFDFAGSGDRFQFHRYPPMIMENKEERLEDGFDNGCKRLKITPSEINAPFEQTNDQSVEEDEDSYPLGLKLRKTPSFLDLVEMKLAEKRRLSRPVTVPSTSPVMETMSNPNSPAQPISEKHKASNFAAKLLRIGTWERVTRYEGDLVAKCYYAKRKLVWEVLDCGLKSKIEIQWSDISALRATLLENQPGILEVEVCHPPLFFRETNPQPRKHTLWQAASDFTGGQAPLCRQHFLQFPEGTLEKHYEKLLQCDFQLKLLSQKPFPSSSSLYFESCDNEYQDYPHQMNDHGPEFVPGFHHTVQNNYLPQLQYIAPIGAVPCQQVQQVQKFEYFRPTIATEKLNSPNSEDTNAKVCDEQRMQSSENADYSEELCSKREQIQEIDSTIEYLMASSQYPRDCNLPRRYSYSLLPSEAGMEGFSSNNLVLNEIATHLLSDPFIAISPDEQKIIKRIKSMCSLINADSTDLVVNVEQTGHQNPTGNTELLENQGRSNLGDGYCGPNLEPIQESLVENPLLHHLPRIASFPTVFWDEIDDPAAAETNAACNQWRWY